MAKKSVNKRELTLKHTRERNKIKINVSRVISPKADLEEVVETIETISEPVEKKPNKKVKQKIEKPLVDDEQTENNE